jgi:hypothetical protein
MKHHLFIFSFNKVRVFFKTILLFFLFSVVVYPVYILVSGKFPYKQFTPNLSYIVGSYGHMYSRTKEVKNITSPIDILFLGSSHAYRGFDPRNFSQYKTFNLGSSSQTPIQTKVLLNRYLDKLNPSLIVYEVYPGTIEGDGVESAIDIVSNDVNDFESIKMSFKLNSVKVYNTLLFAYFVEVFGTFEKFNESIVKDDDTYIQGGYVEKKIKYYKNQTNLKRENNWQLNQVCMNDFSDIIKSIKSKNIKLMLVYAPISSQQYHSYKNNVFIDSVMNSYGVPYYNFNQQVFLDDSLDFYDPTHLNQKGVNKFNAKLNDLFMNAFHKK